MKKKVSRKEKTIKAIAKNLQGGKVPAKYREKYGKRYDKSEAKSAAYAIITAMENKKKTK